MASPDCGVWIPFQQTTCCERIILLERSIASLSSYTVHHRRSIDDKMASERGSISPALHPREIGTGGTGGEGGCPRGRGPGVTSMTTICVPGHWVSAKMVFLTTNIVHSIFKLYTLYYITCNILYSFVLFPCSIPYAPWPMRYKPTRYILCYIPCVLYPMCYAPSHSLYTMCYALRAIYIMCHIHVVYPMCNM